jgi:hypothetical protein
MKPYIIMLLVLGLTSLSYSQDKMNKDSENAKIEIERLPAVVIKSAGDDFSIYIPDNNPDKKVNTLQKKFIAYDLGKDYEGFPEYLVIMEIEKGSLAATYNEKGKLMSVVENYKNVKLPSEVIYSIYKTFPGWQIVNDKYLYTQKEGDIQKKQYNLKIKKGKETRKLTVHPDGKIVSGM